MLKVSIDYYFFFVVCCVLEVFGYFWCGLVDDIISVMVVWY